MSTANTSLRISELDFFTIKENLKNFLRNQSEFQDFDFEGSGMNILMDLLAYNTHYMGYYLNMVGNEMFLDTAQLRNSIISHAKNINYVPTSKQGALMKTNIQITPSGVEDQDTNIITLQKYTKFLGQDIDGINHQFVALYSNTATKSSGSFYFANTFLKQGEVVTRQFLMEPTNTSRRFEIPSANVDISTLTVTVQESSSNTHTTEYSKFEDLLETTKDSNIYYIEENNNLNYTLYFGDDILGKKPKNGNIINITYLDTVGAEANNIHYIYQSDPIANLYSDNVTITVIGSSYGGVDKETIEQVRYRAPYAYTSQNRAVTVLDYENILTKDYPNIESSTIWGGEDNDPIIYGKVFISLKTRGNYALTNLDKEAIKDDLIRKRNILTVTPEIVDPNYIYITIKGTVNYDPRLTSMTPNEIKEYVTAAIQDYNENELNTFRSTFRKSKLQSYIDNSEKSILGSDIIVYLQKRTTLDTTKQKTYDIEFNTKLKKGDYGDRMFTSPYIQTFDYNGISRNIFFEEIPYSATGIDNITVLSGGYNYTSDPTVTITGDGSGATATASIQNGKVALIEIINRGTNYTRATVALSGGEGYGATAIAKLEAKNGFIRAYYIDSNGEKVVSNDSAGTIDYDTGKVRLTAFTTSTGTDTDNYYGTDIFATNFPTAKEIITPLRNRILTIDTNDPLAVQIDVVAE